jgi:predicted DNA binding CopG/RHH family protein
MARTTSIDVARVDLIKRLKEILKEMPKVVKEYETADKAHRQAVKDWAINLANDPSNFKEVNQSYYRNDDSVTITFTAKALKTKPKYDGPEQPRITGYQLTEALTQIRNTVNILELSKSEFVGVSILNKVAAYL